MTLHYSFRNNYKKRNIQIIKNRFLGNISLGTFFANKRNMECVMTEDTFIKSISALSKVEFEHRCITFFV